MGNQSSSNTNALDDDQVVNREARAAYMFVPPLLHAALDHVSGSDVDWDAVGRMAVERKYLLAYTDESYMEHPESFASIELVAAQNQPIDADLMQTFLRVASGNVRMFPEEADADSTHVAALIRKFGVRGVVFAKKLAADVLDDPKAEDIIMMIGKDFSSSLPPSVGTKDEDDDDSGEVFMTEVPPEVGELPREVDARVEFALRKDLIDAEETIQEMKEQMRKLRFELESCEEEKGEGDEIYERLREEADEADAKRERAESMIEYAQRETREMQKIVAGNRERMRSLNEEVEILREKLDKQRTSEEEADRRVAKAEREAEAALAEETRLRQELLRYSEMVGDQDREILDLKEKLAEEQRASERLAEENSDLTSSFEKERARFEKEFQKAYECEEKEKDNERELREARESARKALTSLDEEMSARERAEKKSKEMEERARQKEEAVSQAAGLREELRLAEEENEKLKKEVETSTRKIAELDNTQELSAVREQLRVRTGELQELQQLREELDQRVSALAKRITELEEENQELKIAGVDVPVEGEDGLREKVESLQLEVGGLRSLLDRMVEEQF